MKNWQAKFAGTVTTLFMLALVGFVLLWPVGCSHPIAEPTAFSLTLYWTAPGDNGHTGTASEYDLRVYYEPITDANWNSAIRLFAGVPTPDTAGTPQQATFTYMAEPEVNAYFAIKTADEVPNWSPLSNVHVELTPDIVSPAVIVDLRSVQ